MKARAPRDRSRISTPPPSSARNPKVPPVHMVSLVTTGQSWPRVAATSPTIDAAEKAAAKSPRNSIDIELDFDDPAPASTQPVVIEFGPPPSLEIPAMPKRDLAQAKATTALAEPASAPIADLAPPAEPRARPPYAVAFLFVLSLAGSIAIVALKLIP